MLRYKGAFSLVPQQSIALNFLCDIRDLFFKVFNNVRERITYKFKCLRNTGRRFFNFLTIFIEGFYLKGRSIPCAFLIIACFVIKILRKLVLLCIKLSSCDSFRGTLRNISFGKEFYLAVCLFTFFRFMLCDKGISTP